MSIAVLNDSDILNTNVNITDKMQLISSFAGDLVTILESQNMIVPIRDKKYVLAEGWSLIGQMLGAHVGSIEIHEIPSKYAFCYECTITLHNKNGEPIGVGKAVANSGGFQKEQHTVYSMAQTRALGKAYRLSLAWLIKMAGFEPTPFEEMPETDTQDKPKNNSGMPRAIKKAYDRLKHKGVPITRESIRAHVNWRDLNDEEKELCEQYIENYCPEQEDSERRGLI